MSEERIAFFDLGTGFNPNKTGKEKSVKSKIGCDACNLRNHCKNPEIEPIGNGKKKILIVTEFPGKEEDREGLVLSTPAYKLLERTLKEIDINLDEDCWLVHAVRCSTEDYTIPTRSHVEYCRTKLLQDMNRLEPTVVILLGNYAILSVIGPRISGRLSGIKEEQFFGEIIPDQEYRKYLACTYPIEWLVNKKTWVRGNEVIDPVYLRFFKRTVKKAALLWNTPFYVNNLRSDVLTTMNPEDAVSWIKESIEYGVPISYDYETNSLKPHMKGRKIKTASFSTGPLAYSFPYFYGNKEFERAWYKLLHTKKCGKIAHKMDFENGWTRFKGGGGYAGPWDWDTCLAAHFLNSHKTSQQKFWTYVYLGIIGYDTAVDKYLKPTDKESKLLGGNALNSIDKADPDKTLQYNGEDSLYCIKIADIQKKKIHSMGPQFVQGYNFFLQGAETLSQVQNEGMRLDMDRLQKNKKILTRKIDLARKHLQQFPEWKKWNGRHEFNPLSDSQLSRMLYDILKYKKPEDGSLTDEKQLKRLKSDFASAIIPYRKWLKMRDTYLSQFEREQVNGYIYPFFNLHIPVTYRSSSDSPNFQNMPARDENALKYVMSNIIPRTGNRFVEWDYKGVEVTVSACYHKDSNMIKYLLDDKTDMHRDTAADIVMRDPKDVLKIERQYFGKNGFVFPSFYGSGVASIAPALWDLLTMDEHFFETKKHLKEQGVKSYKDFYAHMEDVYKIFWEERFPIYSEWKKKTWNDYLKKGYVDLKTGFRYYGPAEFTQITNCQIQGSAFHVLLWSLNNIYPKIRDNYENSFIIGQIHDAIVGDINPYDEPSIDKIVKYYGTKKVREHWDWIDLPLKLEKESTEVNCSWNTMEERGFI